MNNMWTHDLQVKKQLREVRKDVGRTGMLSWTGHCLTRSLGQAQQVFFSAHRTFPHRLRSKPILYISL